MGYFDYVADIMVSSLKALITLAVLAGLTVGIGIGALVYHFVT